MHEFSKLNNIIYINLDKSTDVLWHLVVHYKSNHIGSLSPSLGNRTNQYLRIIKEVIRKKLGKTREVIRLPVPGLLALKVHQGFKVFNYKDGTVSKVFASSVPEEMLRKEIETTISASRLDFAPKFIKDDPEKKSYTEELVAGQLAAVNARIDSAFSLSLYDSHIADYLARMITTDQIPDVQVSGILHELSAFIRNDSLARLETTYPALIEIKRFYTDICGDLENFADKSVIKCYSHGDFSLENIIVSRRNVKVIDWEGAESRSILNDFFNYFFTEMYYKRLDVSLDIFDSARQKLLDRLDGTLAKENVKSCYDIYCKIFYLERLKTILERDLNEGFIRVARNSVLLFKTHEALHNDLAGRGKHAHE